MMNPKDHVWKTEALGKRYLEGVRGAIPLAQEQIELMLFLVKQARPQVSRFLDLGCGDGILGQALLLEHPHAKGVFLDFSETMIQAAKDKVLAITRQATFITQEYYHRPDKGVNVLAPVNEQCQWLRDIGYQQVDCYFKVLELALFGGVKAPGTATGIGNNQVGTGL